MGGRGPGSRWQAAESVWPTTAAARLIAVTRDTDSREDRGAPQSVPGDDPCPELMKQLLPELQRTLFPS